jgi:hypothetical protein
LGIRLALLPVAPRLGMAAACCCVSVVKLSRRQDDITGCLVSLFGPRPDHRLRNGME